MSKVMLIPFLASLILAPSIPALLGFLVMQINETPEIIKIFGAVLVAALYLGCVQYMIFGGVKFYRTAQLPAPRPRQFAWAGLQAHFYSLFAVLLVLVIPTGMAAAGFTLFILCFGLIFAPLWGWIFGFLYLSLCKIRFQRGRCPRTPGIFSVK